MPGQPILAWLVVGFLGLSCGCAGSMSSLVAELDGRRAAVELAYVPFHPQVTDQCGPAALATVLNVSGVAVTPLELKSRVYIPDRQGSLQLELLAATRQYDRIAYEIDPTVKALLAELDSGRPVLILQNLGASVAPLWHYAVVVGFLPDGGEFVLRSGDRKRHLLDTASFLRSWERGGLWGIVVLEPGSLPANPEPDRYLHAVAALETTGSVTSALKGYRAATTQWPRHPLGWLGLGNAAYTGGQLRTARDAYHGALAINPRDAIALNNLAQVQLELNCPEKALATLDAALTGASDADPLRAHLLATRQSILGTATHASCEY